MSNFNDNSTTKIRDAGAESASSSPAGLRIDIADSLRRHKFIAAVLFTLVFAAGLAFTFIKGKPKYSATAAIYVSPRFVANLEDDKEFELQSNSQYREYVQQNVRSINRFDIVRTALVRLGDRAKTWVQPGESLDRAAERLQSALRIEPVPDTYQIIVSLDNERPDNLAAIVNSVVDTFLEKIKSEEFYGTDERIKNLRAERTQLIASIEEKQRHRAEFAQKLGVSTFNESFANPYDKLLVDAKSTFAEARRQRIQAEAQLNSLNGSANGGKAITAYANELANRDPGLMSMDANLNQRRSVLLSSISGLAASHPGRVSAERELRELESARERIYRRLVESYSQMLLDQRQADVIKAQKVEQDLQREVERQTAQASDFSRGYQFAMGLGQDMDRERKRISSIDDRISFLSLESRAPGFVRLFSAARDPEYPTGGGRRRLGLLALLAALIAGVATPLALDFLDPRIHWPGDVRSVLGFPPLGWLLEKKEAGSDFAREQILRIANRIDQENHANGGKIFAFTAAKAGSGTTTIVQEVAYALTRLGIPSLAVEANAYRADPSYRSPKSRGLAVVLRGQSNIAAEVVPGVEDRPDFLPVGDVNNFENLPDLHNLVHVLRDATTVYSIVLVDLPPILLSVDAELISRFADVVVLVVSAESTMKGELKRAAEALSRIKPAAVSAILNHVRLDSSAGFGREARDEFYKGAPKAPPAWKTPWLWK